MGYHKKYKVGDQVRVVFNDNGTDEYVGTETVITDVSTEDHRHPYTVKHCFGSFAGDELELITKDNHGETSMHKVGVMMKKLLDADTRELVKAGFINGNLELTPEGTKELMAVLFDTHKAALVARAKEVIAEEKEENN